MEGDGAGLTTTPHAAKSVTAKIKGATAQRRSLRMA
jgi:hypothetical protein